MQTTKNVKVMQQRGPMPPKLFKCHNRPINVLRQPAQPHFILTSMKSRKPSHPNPLLPPMPPICRSPPAELSVGLCRHDIGKYAHGLIDF